jgi:hypothetical protein
LEDYIGPFVGNRKNNFYINFTNGRFDPYRNISFYGTPEKIEGIYIGNSKRKSPEYFIVEAKQLLLKKFLIDYNGKLFDAWINGNLTVTEALSLWNISFETHDYYEYDGKLIDQNLLITQTQNLLTTKIFTPKNRLNGRGKLIPDHEIDNAFQIPTLALEMLAEQINAMIVKDFLNGNQEGIIDMEQTESWNYGVFYSKTVNYETPYLLQLQREGFIGSTMEFFEDPDDPPIEK